MAWIKIPAENHALFRTALPTDRRIETLQMFGGLAAKVNGHLFGGTFGRSVMLLLSEADRVEALALDGAAPFDPMGNGAMRTDKVQMPDAIMDEPAELAAWVRRSFEFAATLRKKSATKKAAAPAKKQAAAPAKKQAAAPAKKKPAKKK
jgi:TfoX/Sxy family transcriptional regulator of competence genes